MSRMAMQDVPERVAAELLAAETARNRGNEGRARVCARRAAGWAIAAHLDRRGMYRTSDSALELLRYIQSDAAVPESVRAASRRLAAKVTTEHQLPHAEDPLEDARRIVGELLSNSPPVEVQP
jgi:hypothetical protein